MAGFTEVSLVSHGKLSAQASQIPPPCQRLEVTQACTTAFVHKSTCTFFQFWTLYIIHQSYMFRWLFDTHDQSTMSFGALCTEDAIVLASMFSLPPKAACHGRKTSCYVSAVCATFCDVPAQTAEYAIRTSSRPSEIIAGWKNGQTIHHQVLEKTG